MNRSGMKILRAHVLKITEILVQTYSAGQGMVVGLG